MDDTGAVDVNGAVSPAGGGSRSELLSGFLDDGALSHPPPNTSPPPVVDDDDGGAAPVLRGEMDMPLKMSIPPSAAGGGDTVAENGAGFFGSGMEEGATCMSSPPNTSIPPSLPPADAEDNGFVSRTGAATAGGT